MIRANVSEDREAIKGRFLNGLNRDIVNMVELQYYLKIEYRVHVAIKVKKQFKKKSRARPNGYLESSRGWKSNFRRERNAQTKLITISKMPNPRKLKSRLQQ